MAYSPTDQSNDFVESGMRLITSPSSDSLLQKSKDVKSSEKADTESPDNQSAK